MKKVIYFFSGTGNSLQVARDLSKYMDNTTIHAITSTTKMDVSAEVIGFVFPVYLWGTPNLVLQFIRQIKWDTSPKYIFAVATYKSQAGDVIGQFQRKLKKYGAELASGFTLSMPGNNIIYYDVESQQVQKDKMSTCQSKLHEIAQAINNYKHSIMPSATVTDRFLKTGLLHGVLINTFHNSDRQFWFESICTGCGLCTKVCPVANIQIKDGHPVWRHNCQQCLACINLCPSKAIQYGKLTKARERYINATISITDMYRRQ